MVSIASVKAFLFSESTKNNFFLLSSRFYTSLLGFVVTIASTKLLSQSDFGIFTAFFSLPVLFGILTTGLAGGTMKLLKEDNSQYLTHILVSIVFAMVTSIVIVPLFLWTHLIQFEPIYLIPLLLIVFGNFLITDDYLKSQNRYKQIAKINISVESILTVFMFVALLGKNVFLLVLFKALYSPIQSLVSLFMARSEITMEFFYEDSIKLIKYMPKNSTWFLSQSFLQINVLLASFSFSKSTVALLGALNIFAQPYLIVSNSLSNTNLTQASREQLRTMITLLLLLIGGTFIINVDQGFWINVLLTQNYDIRSFILPYTVGMVGIGLLQAYTTKKISTGSVPVLTIFLVVVHTIGIFVSQSIFQIALVTCITGGLAMCGILIDISLKMV